MGQLSRPWKTAFAGVADVVVGTPLAVGRTPLHELQVVEIGGPGVEERHVRVGVQVGGGEVEGDLVPAAVAGHGDRVVDGAQEPGIRFLHGIAVVEVVGHDLQHRRCHRCHPDLGAHAVAG